MYHEFKNPFKRNYYDTISEMPKTAKVYFPDATEPVEMTIYEMLKLSADGWYAVVHHVNYGLCDYWLSEPLLKWVRERFTSYWRITDNGKTLGFDRKEWSVRVTRNKNYCASEVWNN